MEVWRIAIDVVPHEVVLVRGQVPAFVEVAAHLHARLGAELGIERADIVERNFEGDFPAILGAR